MDLICVRSNKPFSLHTGEIEYCKSHDIPFPEVSALEGFREMMAFRNESTLYNRLCSKTQNEIISIHRPDTVFPVYSSDIWLSEANDPSQYGRPYDFQKPFFQQFFELASIVPREAQLTLNAENSPYVNINVNVKNCYYTFSCLNSQDCMYGNKIYSCRDCIDNSYLSNCELCYECVNCHNCYGLKWSFHSFHCNSSAFLYGCTNCQDCFGCVGLTHARFCIWNQQCTEEEYRAQMSLLLNGSHKNLEQQKEKFLDVVKNSGYTYDSNSQNEDCSGSYLQNCKDCTNTFFAKGGIDLVNSFNMQNCKDSVRSSFIFDGQLLYRCSAMSKNPYNCQFCYMSPGLVDSQYCAYVFSSEKMFGCIGFPRRASYCILNKQYTKDEYEELLPRIIAHMKATGEWGRWFPLWMSDFPYADTVAQEYFPLNVEQAKELKAHWDAEKSYPFQQNVVDVPDSISDVWEDILNEVLSDGLNKRIYKLQKKELAFYKANTIPVPRECFDTRNLRRSRNLFSF